MRTRSYTQRYSSGDFVMSCICGYTHVYEAEQRQPSMFRTTVQQAVTHADLYVYKQRCPKCKNIEFVKAEDTTLDYISCFDNLASIRLVAQFSTYCYISKQKAFRRTKHRFSICYNKKTSEAHLKFKGKIRQVSRVLRQTNKGHVGKLDDMLRSIIKDPKYTEKIKEFKCLVGEHAKLDSIYFDVISNAGSYTIRSIQNVLTRAYYRRVNDLRCFNGHDFVNSDIPAKVMKVFRDESSTYDALSKICGIRVSKPIYKQIDSTRQFFGLVLASKITKNPDLILKLISSDRCHDNYYPGPECLTQIKGYVDHIGQANIDNAIKYGKLDGNLIEYVADTLRLVSKIRRKNVELPKFHSFRQYHDDLAVIQRNLDKPADYSFMPNGLIPIESEQNGYTFKVCQDTMTLRKLGSDMHNCVNGYLSEVFRGKTIIIDMQLHGKSHCCIEYDVNRRRIVQAKLTCNKRPDEFTTNTIKVWTEQLEYVDISPTCRDLVKIEYHCDYQHGVNLADHHQLLDYAGRRRARLVGMHEAHAGNYMIQGQAAHELAEQQIRAYREAYPDGLQFAQVDFAQAEERVLAGLQHDAIIQDEYAPIDALLEDE